MKKAAALIFIFVLSGCSADISRAGVHEDLADKYIKISGTDKIIAVFPDQLEAMHKQRLLTSENPDLEKKIASTMKESFDVGLAKQNFRSYLLGNTDVNFLKKLNQWFETPLGKKIKEEEILSSGPESQTEMLKYIADLQTKPPSQDRIATIQKLEKTMKLSELATDIYMELTIGMLEAFNIAAPEKKRKEPGSIKEEIEKNKFVIQETMRQQMIFSSFYSYRNISGKELMKYIDFYESETGKKEIKVITNALGFVFKKWSLDVGEKIIALKTSGSI